MTWKYSDFTRRATHIESGAEFQVKFGNAAKTSDDLDLIALRPEKHNRRDLDIEAVKAELWSEIQHVWEQQKLRLELQKIINDKFSGDNLTAASVLSRESGRDVSVRSIQAWLIEPDKRSSRNCPPWAVDYLKKYLRNPQNKEAMLAHAKFARRPGDRLSPMEIIDRNGLRLAEAQVSATEHRLHEWQEAGLPKLAQMLFKLEHDVQDELALLDERLRLIQNVVEESSPELKLKLSSMLSEAAGARFELRKARESIERMKDPSADTDEL